jgi:hypothetical protein
MTSRAMAKGVWSWHLARSCDDFSQEFVTCVALYQYDTDVTFYGRPLNFFRHFLVLLLLAHHPDHGPGQFIDNNYLSRMPETVCFVCLSTVSATNVFLGVLSIAQGPFPLRWQARPNRLSTTVANDGCDSAKRLSLFGKCVGNYGIWKKASTATRWRNGPTTTTNWRPLGWSCFDGIITSLR